MYLIFDTETTGLPGNWNAPLSDFENWPRCIQLAWQLHRPDGSLVSSYNALIRPEGFTIPFNAEKVHGISTDRALREGVPLAEALAVFSEALAEATHVAGHNVQFDINIIGCEYLRGGQADKFAGKKVLDTKDLSTDYCALPGGKGGKYKWPSLSELYRKLFDTHFQEAHDAGYDTIATGKCFFELIQRGIIRDAAADPGNIAYEPPVLSASNFQVAASPVETVSQPEEAPAAEEAVLPDEVPFVHLHVHTQYSVLQSASDIARLIKAAAEMKMPAIAMTDHGNMMGAFQFVSTALKHQVKPIVGCEINLCRNHADKTTQDNGFQVPLLAMNKEGYHHLAKLTSRAHTHGFYYVPRVDRDLLLAHADHLLALTGGLFGEVPWRILNEGEERAEEAFVWWKENFGDRFYAEIMRHGLEEEQHVNQVLLKFCEKHGVKYVAANAGYYTQQEDAEVQDALVCIREGEFMSKPSRYIGKRGREYRFGLPNDQYYLKSPEAMHLLFRDLPAAIENTLEIADRCESYALSRDVLLPRFDLPAAFTEMMLSDGKEADENSYLRYLTYEGAARRYSELTDEARERIEFELGTITNAGYAGYFLIVQDFCNKAREMGVSVGPGRGSAAGSVVAYCTGITNVDPIRYQLLFERFLNPERVSMPDIDIDFDDKGRDLVIDYVRRKYGEHMVAQIITFGTMGGKSAIRDAGRVLELPLPDTDRLAKLMPDGIDLSVLLKLDNKALADKLNASLMPDALRLRELAATDSPEARVLRLAARLEGNIRNTGIHACGVIITPQEITNYVPVSTAKDSDMWCTQFDNSVVESAGLLKMDFLGLSTLTLIKDTLQLIKERKGIDIDIDAVPLDDTATYELFQRGHTMGTFQYESEGMQKCMKELKPTVFDDLIAMNALYRPGPMDYIPSFIRRKAGTEQIRYDLPEMEEFLKDTYGITVYQEQVMLLSQKLAGFSRGDADVLRKAMGKKQKDVLDKMKGKFIDGATALGHPPDKLEKIWTDWEAFASYAFNKSHSTCYAWIGYQTAWLKANYPAEYMAAVLSNNMSDIKKVGIFMQVCKKMGIAVLGPDVNESKLLFSVNEKGQIRFGLAAVKGVGESAVHSIIEEQKKGRFTGLIDYLRRVDARASNKKTIESLVLSGAFDGFGLQRSAFFAGDGKNETYIETLVRFASALRETKNSAQVSLFGDESAVAVVEPVAPKAEPWDAMTQLNREKEVVGMYISGHPLDDFELDIRSFGSKGGLQLLEDLQACKNRDLRFAGVVNTSTEKIARSSNKPFGTFVLEDYESSQEFVLFGEDYLKHKHLLYPGAKVFVFGKVQPRKFGNDPNALEFKINRIDPLFEIRDRLARYLDVHIPVNKVNTELVDKLFTVLDNEKGKTQLRVNVITDEGTLVLPSLQVRKLMLTAEIQSQLEQFEGLKYELHES